MGEVVAGDFYPAGLAPAGDGEPVMVGGLTVRRHPLTPETLRALARGLAGRGALARAVPAKRIVDELGALHARWAAAESPLRREAVERLHAATGYAEIVIDEGLQRLFSQMDAVRLEEWLVRGGAPPAALDGDPAGQGLLAFGPRLTAVVSSGNVPGAALPSVVQALLLKSPCLVKTASAEPVLLPFYARSLGEQSPELAQSVAVTGWEGGDAALEAALLPEVEALIAYGGDEAIRSLRDRLPVRSRFIGYGHRLSFTAIGRELLADEA
ncbi:MAG: acyl-CoA reductase, partial [Actinomycetota bacterium]